MIPPYWAKGMLLVIAIILLVVTALILSGFTSFFLLATQNALNYWYGKQAFYLAESGLQVGAYVLLSPAITPTTAPIDQRMDCNGLSLPTQGLGPGNFSLTSIGTTPYAPTPLGLATGISATAVIIPSLTALTGFAPFGRIVIDREAMEYTALQSGSALCNGYAYCFTGINRGQGGTQAVAHNANALISQYQCTLQSVGTVPGPPSAQRTLQQALQWQKAWVVGDVVNNTPLIGIWSGSGWALDTIASASSAALYAVSMVNYGNGWAVGDISGKIPLILKYLSTGWTDQGFTNNAPKQALNGVYCLTFDNCWAVGNKGTIVNYSATANTWSSTTFTNTVPNTALSSVDCPNASVCWATGAGNAKGNIMQYLSSTNTWSAFASLNSPVTNLTSISCPSGNECWAVGNVNNKTGFISHYQAASGWSSNGFSATLNTPLTDIYCLPSGYCISTGNQGFFQYTPNTTTWSPMATNASLAGINFYSVACYSISDCYASGASLTLAHWDGNQWQALIGPIQNYPNLYGLDVVGPRQFANGGYLVTNALSSWQNP